MNRAKKFNRYFGEFGGRFVPEMLIPALNELEEAYFFFKKQKAFKKELDFLLRTYCGRPTPLYFAENLTSACSGGKIYLKLEGLAHTGAHKINNVIGQALLAKKMGKKKVVAETGAGQHGLATASVCAKFGLKCIIFMGEVDIKRQYPNVFSMRLLGAEVIPVKEGTKTLKDAVNMALKYWIENLKDTHYLLGSVVGPYPYPVIVRDFQSVIGKEVKKQILELEERLPDAMIACCGGGSNAMGFFHPFLKEKNIQFIAVEAGGRGKGFGQNALRFSGYSRAGIAQGYKSYFIQDRYGQLGPTHSVSAGLDYPGIGPELAFLHDKGVIRFEKVSDEEAITGYKKLASLEGIIPALESAHALSWTAKKAGQYGPDNLIVVNVSGRGDKDIFITAKKIDHENWMKFLKEEAGSG
ncbi:MAG: tryptophan synthase subunit beta [Acidobacteriota bacterium]